MELVLFSLFLCQAQVHEQELPPATRVVWQDFDRDGLADAFVLANDGPARLLRNAGDGSFEPVAGAGLEALGDPALLAFGDHDRDGFLDLFVGARSGRSQLLRNLEGKAFVDASAALPCEIIGPVLRAEWVDVDRDELPDLHVSTAVGETLLHNLGTGAFAEVELWSAPLESGVAPATGVCVAERELVVAAGPVSGSASGTQAGPSGFGPRGRAAVGASADSPHGSPPSGAPAALVVLPTCALTLRDQATGECLGASSSPTLGAFYPLGPEFNIDPAGNVGIGTLGPLHRLHVESAGAVAVYGLNTASAPRSGGEAEAVGIFGEASGLMGTSIGLRGLARGPEATGVSGEATSPTGPTAGVRGDTRSPDGVGLEGIARDPARGVGLRGLADGRAGVGAEGRAVAKDGPTVGVRGEVNSPEGTGVEGKAKSATGPTVGVSGCTSSPDGTGVDGKAEAPAGPATGVRGTTKSPDGVGVEGRADNPAGGVGVRGERVGRDGIGVEGRAIDPTGDPSGAGVGVGGRTGSPAGAGVEGHAHHHVGGVGVRGITGGTEGKGVEGRADSPTGPTTGVHGTSHSSTGVGVRGTDASVDGTGIAILSEGALVSTGPKAFAQPHPTDPSKEIRFLCLEGNESGTYFRGTARLRGGRALVEIPEEFRLVSEPAGLTVQVTALGDARLWVEQRSLAGVLVRGTADVEFDYFVQGVRRGFAGFEPVGENVCFRPRVRGAPFGLHLRPEQRALLVGNGLLCPDSRPDEETCAALGWTLVDPGDRPDERVEAQAVASPRR
jgi:hypothetical protein